LTPSASATSLVGLMGVPHTIMWIGLYLRGSRLRFARPPPPKTAPQRRPKGSLSLTQMSGLTPLKFA